MNPHKQASKTIVSLLIERIKNKKNVYIIMIAGASGCGKTETGKALVNEFEQNGVSAL